MEGSPSSVKEGLTKTVRLTCSLNDTASSSGIIGRRGVTTSNIPDSTSTVDAAIASSGDRILPRSGLSVPTTETPYNVDEVMSIIVTQNGADVAAVTHTHPPKVEDSSNNLQVSGHILNAASGQGFIELTWDNPSAAQLANLGCHVTAMDVAGHSVAFSQSIEYDVSMPTIMDVVTHVTQLEHERDIANSKIQLLETKNEVAVNAINSLNSSLTSSISRVAVLETEQAITNNKLSTLQTENNAMKSTIDHIRHIETGRVGVSYVPVHVSGTGERDKFITVKFQHAYDNPPKVVLGTVLLDMAEDKNIRYGAFVQNIDTSGFEIKFHTWSDSKLYELFVDWVSIPA